MRNQARLAIILASLNSVKEIAHVLENGFIVQGQDNGVWSHAIHFRYPDDLVFHDLHVTVAGHNTSCVYHWDGSLNQTIYNCDFTSNVITITSRDHADGAVLNNVTGNIYNNSINNGPHIGITRGKAIFMETQSA